MARDTVGIEEGMGEVIEAKTWRVPKGHGFLSKNRYRVLSKSE